MSAQANIVAYDGASTPVAHTLVASGVSLDAILHEEIALWKEEITSLPDYAQVSCKTTKRKLKSGIMRVGITVTIPIMESVAGQNSSGYTAAPKVAYSNTVQFVGLFHERSSIAERRTVRQLLVNISNNISTSVAAATAGPASELIDTLKTAS